MFDVDTINQMNVERKREEAEERQLKNKILNLPNAEMKQRLYRENFGQTTQEVNNLIF